MNRTLILGGAGFIGANLIRSLIQQGHKPSIVELPDANLGRIERFNNRINVHSAGLSEKSLIEDIIRQGRITEVIHLVSGLLPSSGESDFQAEIDSVVKPTKELLPVLREYGCRLVFFSSGGAIYGRGPSTTLAEGDPLDPLSYYGKSKQLLEDTIREYGVKEGLNYLIIRPSNPYGRFQSSHGAQGFVAVAAGKILRGDLLTIWGDGSVVRDYLLVDDLVSGVLGLMESGRNQGIYNIGSGRGHSLIDVVRMIEGVAGVKARLEFLPGRSCDPVATILDISKLRSVIPFNPLGLEEGLKIYLDELRGNAF
ncbi:NAD-dependent epimerase/dehydratase family protein [Geothrix sp. SG200]|uniref:NAD-dependent epimerase/dehydratase family protein n=1 Tax=Geothrix sp. SG200 TaxID=2922865 RepID=UPI001FACF929|nr:NAD-dependent epimerase/dehydratase family protein [Geothrix sp. SG200]